MKPDLTIVIPCYNEEESLPVFLTELLPFCENKHYNIIIINDGSTDNSLSLLLGISNNNVTILNNKVNKGYGAAIKSGIEKCKTEYMITIDADGQHYFEDIDKLFSEIIASNSDMIVGSRKGQFSNNIYRDFGKWIIRRIAKFLMPIKIHDLNSGMKIYKTELAKKYLSLYPDSMAFSDIIGLVFINKKLLVNEIPISIKKRKSGSSTINTKTAFQTVLEILNIIILFNPLKIFLPVSIMFVFFGLIWGFYIFSLGRGISVGSSLLIISGLLIFLLGLVAEQMSQIRHHLTEFGK